MLKKIWKFYWLFIASPESYARHIGVAIGKQCFINTRHWSSEPYLISIGNYVGIASDVRFHTHGGGHVARREYPKFDVFGRIKVYDYAYIGAGSQILPGVTIGEGALVAAGSIVTKSVASGTVVAGNPAKYICTVKEYIEKNLKYNINSKSLSSEEKKKLLLSLSDEHFIQK